MNYSIQNKAYSVGIIIHIFQDFTTTFNDYLT